MNTQDGHKIYFTQKEMALRWNISESCVKNYREQGKIPFFRMPGSNRVLYPVKGIEEIEAQNTISAKEVVKRTKPTEIKKEKPGVSSTPKKWRI